MKYWVSFCLFFLSEAAWGWKQHQLFMPQMLQMKQPHFTNLMKRKIPLACHTPERHSQIVQILLQKLKWNPQHELAWPDSFHCHQRSTAPLELWFTSSLIDEPHLDNKDPLLDSSFHLRHFYFPGWNFQHPWITLQWPLHSIGKTPEHIEYLLKEALLFFQAGEKAWSMRLIAWCLHYLQDLHQPFHVVQIPHKSLLAWSELLQNAPWKSQNNFWKQSQTYLDNFRNLYESYIFFQLNLKPSMFETCLLDPEKWADVPTPIFRLSTWIDQTLEKSIEFAKKLSHVSFNFLGPAAFSSSHLLDLESIETLVQTYAAQPDLLEERNQLNAISCELLASNSLLTRHFLQWVLAELHP